MSGLRCLFLLLLLSGPLPAQNEALLDSLEAEVVRSADQDSLRFRALGLLWRHTLYNDLDRSEGYARRILREGSGKEDVRYAALGHRTLGIIMDYRGRGDSARYHYERGISLYRDLGNRTQEGTLLFNLAILHNEAGRKDSALVVLALADSAFVGNRYQQPRAAVKLLYSTIARERGQFKASLEAAIESFDVSRSVPDSARMGDAAVEIAQAYRELGEDSLMLVYEEMARDIFRRLDDPYFEAMALCNLARSYAVRGRPEEALASALRAIQLVEENGLEEIEFEALAAYGAVLRRQGRPEAAERQYLRAVALADDEHHDSDRVGILQELSYVQLELGKFAAARRTATETLRLAEEQGQLTFAQSALDVLVKTAREQGDAAAALVYLERRQVYQDSLYRRELAAEMAELSLRFERAEQDRRLAEQRSQLALLEEQRKVDRLQKIGLGLGLLLTLALLGLLYFAYRQRLLRQRLEKDRLDRTIREQRKDLSAHALQMSQKSRLLDELSAQLREVRGERPDDRKKLDRLLREIGSEERIDQDWDNFRTYFQGVHGGYLERVRKLSTAKLSPREERLVSLIRMQLSNAEIASILGVTPETLYKAKYRLGKKLPAFGEGENVDGFLRGV